MVAELFTEGHIACFIVAPLFKTQTGVEEILSGEMTRVRKDQSGKGSRAPLPGSSRSRTRRRVLHWVAGVAIVGLFAISACSDATGPNGLPGTTNPGVKLQDWDLLVAILADDSERILPELPEDPRRDEVARTLTALSAALEKGGIGPMRVALDGATSAIARYAPVAAGDPGTAAGLEAIRIVTDIIALQLAAQTGK